MDRIRGAELAAAVAFVGFAALQANDPDPVRWAAVYGAAAALCAWPARPAGAAVALGVLALGWAGALLPGVLAEAELADLVRTMKHENHAEEARELSGLLIVAGACAALAARAGRSAALGLAGGGVLAGLGGVALGRPSPPPPVPVRPRPVLFVVVDTLRADHLGAYGFDGPISPALDRFAAQSLVFERCYAQAPMTVPSMATAFTSLAPSTHGVRARGSRVAPLPAGARTLAEALAAEGWRTGAFVANDWLQPKLGYARGFDRYVLPPPGPGRKAPAGESVLAAARAWLGDGDGRWFAWVHLMDVHFPYRPLDAGAAALVGSASLGDRLAMAPRDRANLPPWLSPQLAAPPADLRHLRLWYAGGVRGTDDLLGAFLEDLEARGVLDDAIVVLTADHGEELVEAGGFGHGHTVREELVHVPLMVRIPGVAGRRVRATVSLVDLAPTLLAALGVPPLPLAQGRDLGLLGGRDPAPATSFAESNQGHRSARTPDWTLVRDRAGVDHLYAAEDLAHAEDRAAEEPDVVARLSAELTAHVAATSAAVPGVADEVRLDDDLQDQLRALGYVVGRE